MNKLLSNIRIILLHTSHPGNIGSVARAMKVMGLDTLYLVNPACDPWDGLAKAMASHANDVWQHAIIVKTLSQALTGVHLIFGTTARNRSFYRDCLTANQMAKRAITYLDYHRHQNVAIVFGSEKNGLSNHELDRCHYQVRIPTSSCYSSLNLAQAVQIICYEIYQFIDLLDGRDHCDQQTLKKDRLLEPLATSDAIEGVYQHLKALMRQTFFYKSKPSKRMETRIRQLLNRAKLREQDVHLLRGLLNAVMKRILTKRK